MECVVLISFASWLCRSTVRALPTFLQIIKPLPRCRRAMSQLVLLHNLQLVLRMAFESVCVCVCVCAPGGGGGGGFKQNSCSGGYMDNSSMSSKSSE